MEMCSHMLTKLTSFDLLLIHQKKKQINNVNAEKNLT